MKGLGLVSLLAAAIIAASASSSDLTVPTLTKNRPEYSFQLYIKEYCKVDPASTQSKIHAYAGSNYGDGYEYGWAFEKSSPKTFVLGDVSISIHHDVDTSETFFESGDCRWKDGYIVKESCGWCDRGMPWIGAEGTRQIDCSAHPELFRHRTFTCHLWHKTELGSAPLPQLIPGEKANGAGAMAIDFAGATDVLDASTPEAREMTGNRKTPENLYRFTVAYSEWCENGALKARGWWHGKELNFYKDNTQKIPINLHPGLDLLLGPYSYDRHAFGIEYDGCAWTSEGGWPCGWCTVKSLTPGALNCQTLQPGFQRTSYRICYFADNHMNGNARRDIETPPTSSLHDNTSFSLVTPPVITAPAHLIDINQADTDDSLDPTPTVVGAETITLMPHIIHTVLPDTPKGQEDLVVPFHVQVWEYCFSGLRLAAGVWRNGNMAQSLNFTSDPSKLNIVQTGAKDLLAYYSIDFDFETSRVKFGYPWVRGEQPACDWFDSEGWRSCGECREKLWSSGPLDCEDPHAVGLRAKDMDCSLLLVKKPMFKLVPQ